MQKTAARWSFSTTVRRCFFCFTLSRIPAVKAFYFVTMYYYHPCLLASSLIAKQNFSTV